MKQIGLATMMYTQDYDEWYPMGARRRILWSLRGTWRYYLQPYVRSSQVFLCPSDNSGMVDAGDYLPVSYGISYTVAGWCSAANLAGVQYPSQTVFAAEMDSTNANQYTVYPTNISWAPAGSVVFARHFEGSNFMFMDGHAKWLKKGADLSPTNLWMSVGAVSFVSAPATNGWCT